MADQIELVDVLLHSLSVWSDKSSTGQEGVVKKMIQDYFLFSPSDSFIRLMAALPSGCGLSIGYAFQFTDSLEGIFQTMSYTECFYEFYTLTHLIPLLNHGDGRIYDLYDCKTDAIIQFNILDRPSEWVVLARSFDEIVLRYFEVLQGYKRNLTLPDSIYQRGELVEQFQTLDSLFPERATELDSILPQPLVLRTHQPGTWQIDKLSAVHEIIKHCPSDDSSQLKLHLERCPQDLRLKSTQGSEPIHIACQYGRYECLRFILQLVHQNFGNEGVKDLLSATDKSLKNPLLVCCSELFQDNINILKCVDLILSYGPEFIDVDWAQDEGQTALHLVSGFGYPYFVQKLLKLGANPSARDHDTYGAQTPLHSLCRLRGGRNTKSPLSDTISQNHFKIFERNNIAVLRLLIESGVDVNARTVGDESTPLHLLMWGSGMEDNSDLVEILCQSGADVNAVTKNRVSILDSGFCQEKYSHILMKWGATTKKISKKRKVILPSRTVIFRAVSSDPQPVLKSANAIMGFSANEAIAAAQDEL